MVVPDLKLVVSVDMGKLGQIPAAVKKANDQANAENKRAAEAAKSLDEKNERDRIARQRQSISLEEGLRAKREAAAKASASRMARVEYDLAVAQAGATTERFERLKLIENANYKLRLSRMIGNDKEMEIEAERHTAKLEAIEAQAGAFSSTPFQKLLGHLGTLTGRKTNEIRESGEAALGLMGVEAEGGGKAAASEIGGMGAAGGAMAGGVFAATAAAGLLVVGLYEATKAAKAAREAEEGLESSLRTSGREETLSSERLEAYAKALARSSKFSIDQALAAESMILPFRNLSNQEIPRLLQLSADLAAKMGKSLPDAASQLGRAFENPEKAARALREANVILTDAETKQLKKWEDMGQAGAAHEFLFKRLTDAIGGYARDTVHNTEIVGHKWEELEAKVGKSVLKIGDAIASLFVGDDSAKSGRNQLTEIERINKEIEDKEIAAIRSRYMHGRATTQQEIAAMNAAIDAFRKQEAAKAAAKPEAGPEADTPAQIENQRRLQVEIEKAKAEGIQDGTAKAIALEQIRYEDEKRLSLGSKTEAALIEQDHQTHLRDIRIKAAAKSLEDMEKDEAKRTEISLEVDRMIEELDKQEAERKKKNDAARVQADKVYRDTQTAAIQNSGTRSLKALETQEADELEKFNASEDAKTMGAAKAEETRTNIHQKYINEKLRLEKQAVAQSGQILSQGLGVVMGLYHKHGAEYKAWAQAKNAVDTSMAAMAAYESAASIPYVGWIMGPVAAGVAVAAGLENASKINSAQFYTGGYTGHGNPHDFAGMVHKDEYVVDHSTLAKAGGPAGVEHALSGRGGVTHTGNVIIQIQAPAGMSQAQARDLGAAAHDGYVDRLKEWRRMQKDADYYGVTA